MAVFLLFSSMALPACDNAGLPWLSSPTVRVVAAERRTVPFVIEQSGTLRPVMSVEIRARTPGYLLERRVEDGTDVEQDQLLFRIQADAQAAAVERARGQLARDEAALATMEREVERAATRGGKRAAARDAILVEAKALGGAVLEARAELAKAELELAYTEIRSPIAGRINARQVDVGNLVGQNEATLLASVVQLDPIYLYLEIPERDLPAIQAAQQREPLAVEVILPDGSAHPEPGRIDFIGNAIDASSRTVLLRAVVANPDKRLLAEEAVRARLRLAAETEAIVVPAGSVVEEDDRLTVLVVEEADRLSRRRVVSRRVHGGLRVIEEGLAEGDLVVIDAPPDARSGDRVRPERTDLGGMTTDPKGG
jgi:membrane fusion protein (multidrug efflux system)